MTSSEPESEANSEASSEPECEFKAADEYYQPDDPLILEIRKRVRITHFMLSLSCRSSQSFQIRPLPKVSNKREVEVTAHLL